MTNASLKRALGFGGACLAAYAGLCATLAFAGPALGPAPLVGVVGGPVGIAAAGVAFGGYLLIKHFRSRR